MNKQIKELYEQAHIEHRQEYFSSVVDPTIKSVSVTRHFNPEKFAELIIKDCLELADLFEIDVNQSGLVSSIKNHFGIEE